MVAVAVVVVVGALAAAGRLDEQAVERLLTLLLGYGLGRGPGKKPNDGLTEDPKER